MDLNQDKIPSPFRTPDGYFEDFESRLLDKLDRKPEKQIKVSNGRSSVGDYLAVAATLAVILLTGWFVFFNTKPKPELHTSRSVLPVNKPDTALSQVQVLVRENPEDAVMEVIIEELENPEFQVKTASQKIKSTDMPLARDLEDAGLIVLDPGDGIFDEFEL